MMNEKGQEVLAEKGGTHRSDRAREGGFSVIELVLAMILVGIIAAITIPRFPPRLPLGTTVALPSCVLCDRGGVCFSEGSGPT